MKKMVSMELDDEDKLDAPMPIPMPEKPDYPYGLRISLGEKEIEKLGIDVADASVGGRFTFSAIARVKSISANDSEGGSSCYIEAQIEDMCIDEAEG